MNRWLILLVLVSFFVHADAGIVHEQSSEYTEFKKMFSEDISQGYIKIVLPMKIDKVFSDKTIKFVFEDLNFYAKVDREGQLSRPSIKNAATDYIEIYAADDVSQSFFPGGENIDYMGAFHDDKLVIRYFDGKQYTNEVLTGFELQKLTRSERYQQNTLYYVNMKTYEVLWEYRIPGMADNVFGRAVGGESNIFARFWYWITSFF